MEGEGRKEGGREGGKEGRRRGGEEGRREEGKEGRKEGRQHKPGALRPMIFGGPLSA